MKKISLCTPPSLKAAKNDNLFGFTGIFMSTLPPDSPEDEGSLASRLVRQFLHRHGLPPHRHAPWLAKALNMTYTTALRRLTGHTGWDLDDLAAVAQAMGAPLGDLLRSVTDEGAVAALLVTGPLRQPCQLWLGKPIVQAPPAGLLIATPLATALGTKAASADSSSTPAPTWVVFPASTESPPATSAHHVRRLVIDSPTPAPPRVAVLDDQADTADMLTLSLTEAGFDAQAFTTLDALRTAATQRPFDGYVMDWLLGDQQTAATLTAALRRQQPQAPILILTGELDTGSIDDEALLRSAKALHFDLIEKPARASVVALKLDQALAGKRTE